MRSRRQLLLLLLALEQIPELLTIALIDLCAFSLVHLSGHRSCRLTHRTDGRLSRTRALDEPASRTWRGFPGRTDPRHLNGSSETGGDRRLTRLHHLRRLLHRLCRLTRARHCRLDGRSGPGCLLLLMLLLLLLLTQGLELLPLPLLLRLHRRSPVNNHGRPLRFLKRTRSSINERHQVRN